MTDFPYARLRRFPDVEAENLLAYDATDRMLADRALTLAEELGLSGAEIAVIGDEYGAITLRLAAAGLDGIRVHQDSATGRHALENNAQTLELSGFTSHELDTSLLAGARLVLLQLPKALAELEESADAVARWAASDVTLVTGGRVKHMTLAQNDVLGRSFAQVQAERAAQKSRLVVANGALSVPTDPPFPVYVAHDGFTLAAHGGAFAGARVDVGTRVLMEALAIVGGALRHAQEPGGAEGAEPQEVAELVEASVPTLTVVDLGCGTGALAAAYAMVHPEAHVIATDRSAAAVASATATMIANGIADRVTVTHDDAGSRIPDASVDIVLLNPPFHLGTSVHTGAATRLFEASARVLRPGGELWTVYNSSLSYRPQLTALIGQTEQVHRTSKFTVTRSIRR